MLIYNRTRTPAFGVGEIEITPLSRGTNFQMHLNKLQHWSALKFLDFVLLIILSLLFTVTKGVVKDFYMYEVLSRTNQNYVNVYFNTCKF